MITVLVGHRGVGKSTLAQSLEKSQIFDVIDLDKRIEELTGQPISQIFLEQGELRFRELEKVAFQSAIANVKRPTIIAVGAGFGGEIPKGARVVWVRRSTDPDGRIFLNRPRINTHLGPLEDYKTLFAQREVHYRKIATEILQLPEGYTKAGAEGLLDFFKEDPDWNIQGDLTLAGSNIRTDFLLKRVRMGVRRFELRTDLLSEKQIARALEYLKPEQIIFSVRSANSPVPALKGVTIDWPLELGRPTERAKIISLHQRGETLKDAILQLSEFESYSVLKLAVEIKDFSELFEGHQWWMKDPQHRAFLPNSSDGRWLWYRSLFGPQMPIHYIREDEGSSLDQPFLWQAILQPKFAIENGFAAVLGAPVYHSRTPMEHRDFFAKFQIPVVAVRVDETEWTVALAALASLGLKFAAVTSPLKALAKQSCESETELLGVNTLVRSKGSWIGTNTDVVGIREFDEATRQSSLALWGGGGTRDAVEAVFPNIAQYSARTGILKAGSDVEPDTLIWAVGRNREFKWPPQHWKLKKIIDLNYSDNSPGLELAVERGLAYQSGLDMFWAQAKAQRIFWQRFL